MKYIFHITKIDQRLHYYTETAVKKILKAEADFYFAVRNTPLSSEVNIEHEKNKALSALRYHNFVTDKGERNYFMWDNECYEQKIRKTFTHNDYLKSAYKTHFKPELVVKKQMSEDEHLKSPDSWEIVLSKLDEFRDDPKKFQSYKRQLQSLGLDFMIEAHSILGTDKIRELGFNYKKIESNIGDHKEKRQLTPPEVTDAIYGRYNVGDVVPISEIRDFITNLYDRYQIKLPKGRKRIDKTIVSIFFEIEEKKIKRGNNRAYLLKSKLL